MKGNQDRGEPFGYVNLLLDENNNEIKGEQDDDYLNGAEIFLNQFISEQHIDVVKRDNYEWSVTTAPTPNDEIKDINSTCIDADGMVDDSSDLCHQENITCVGAPEYCNYTYEEYQSMLYDYIFPTTGEWILIGFHAAVFTIGLVSFQYFFIFSPV